MWNSPDQLSTLGILQVSLALILVSGGKVITDSASPILLFLPFPIPDLMLVSPSQPFQAPDHPSNEVAIHTRRDFKGGFPPHLLHCMMSLRDALHLLPQQGSYGAPPIQRLEALKAWPHGGPRIVYGRQLIQRQPSSLVVTVIV
jgi:hypothetical protein